MSLKQYKDYKDSGVNWLGNLPVEWKISKFRHVASICKGKCPDQLSDVKSITTQVPYLTMDYLRGNTENIRWLNPTNETLLASEKDILLLWDGSNAGEFITARPGAVSSTMAVLYNKSLHNRYFFYVCKSIESEIQQATIGMGIPHVNGDYIKDTPIPSPTIKEQVAIATFLDRETAKIDELIYEQQRLIELLMEKRQAVISHAVTKGLNSTALMKDSGIKWLGEVPIHWKVKKVKHIKSDVPNAFVDGPFGSNLKSEHFIEGGDVYVIESGFATQGRLDIGGLKTISLAHFHTINRSETKSGDIIIAKIGAQFGKSSILPDLDKPAVVSGNSLKLTINHKICNINFINWQLVNLKQIGVIDEIVNGTAQPALTLCEMNNLPILIPPVAEQNEIVNFLTFQLNELDSLIDVAQQAIALLQERRTALITAAVTGKVDVRGLIESEENT